MAYRQKKNQLFNIDVEYTYQEENQEITEELSVTVERQTAKTMQEMSDQGWLNSEVAMTVLKKVNSEVSDDNGEPVTGPDEKLNIIREDYTAMTAIGQAFFRAVTGTVNAKSKRRR